MSCKRCSPHPPSARPLGATKRSWYGHDGWLRDPYRASVIRIERVETEDIGWGQRQIAAQKRRDEPRTGNTNSCIRLTMTAR